MNNCFKGVTVALTLMVAVSCDGKRDSSRSEWPSRPVKVIVPFGEGGGSDIFARQLIRAIESGGFLKQPMVA